MTKITESPGEHKQIPRYDLNFGVGLMNDTKDKKNYSKRSSPDSGTKQRDMNRILTKKPVSKQSSGQVATKEESKKSDD